MSSEPLFWVFHSCAEMSAADLEQEINASISAFCIDAKKENTLHNGKLNINDNIRLDPLGTMRRFADGKRIILFTLSNELAHAAQGAEDITVVQSDVAQTLQALSFHPA